MQEYAKIFKVFINLIIYQTIKVYHVFFPLNTDNLKYNGLRTCPLWPP